LQTTFLVSKSNLTLIHLLPSITLFSNRRTRVETLFFLPDSARAHLADMGHCVDQEMTQSQRGQDLETEAARQPHYIRWAKISGIPDPCSYYKGFIRIVAIYIKYVQCIVNYNNEQVLCSATVGGYTEAVNNLFKLTSFTPLANLSDPNNMMAILLNNMLREEDIARQRAPLYNFFWVKLRRMATASKCEDSVTDLLFNVVALGCYIRPCLSKYTQTTQNKVDHHTYPSLKRLSRLSLPTTSSSTMRGCVSSKNEQRIPPTSPFCQDYLADTKELPEWPIDYPRSRV
jgi:hypothetical protein